MGSPDPVSVGIPRSDLLVSYGRRWQVLGEPLLNKS